jgi:hypothetical protein
MSHAVIAQPLADPEVVIRGLDYPVGVAVQPQTNHVFVAEGVAARVVRIVDQRAEPVLLGFPRKARPMGSAMPEIGPRGMTFLNRSTLAVLGTGEKDRGDPLVIAEAPAPTDPPRTVETALQLTVADSNADQRWQLQGVTVVGSAVLCAMTSGNGRSGIARFMIQNPAELERSTSYGPCELFATINSANGDRLVCLTSSPRGELVAGHRAVAEPHEGRITFHRATDGMPLLQLATGVPTLTMLTYGPRRSGEAVSHLYALCGSRTEDGGGLYRLDAALADGQVRIRPQKLASLNRPTAMAWAGDGSLYVTILGNGAADATQPAGELIRFPSPF